MAHSVEGIYIRYSRSRGGGRVRIQRCSTLPACLLPCCCLPCLCLCPWAVSDAMPCGYACVCAAMLRINATACASREGTSIDWPWCWPSDIATPHSMHQPIGYSLLEDGKGHWGYWHFGGGLAAYRDIGGNRAKMDCEVGPCWPIYGRCES